MDPNLSVGNRPICSVHFPYRRSDRCLSRAPCLASASVIERALPGFRTGQQPRYTLRRIAFRKDSGVFFVGEIGKPSGNGRTATWEGMVGTVTRVEGKSVFVQWHYCAVEDELTRGRNAIDATVAP
jgi:hypothetical protein